jgi:hypothetical protein
MLNQRLSFFLSKNLVGETIICKYNNLICYGEPKILTEMLSGILVVIFLLLYCMLFLLIFDNFIEERSALLLRLTYISGMYTMIKLLECLLMY